MASESSASPSGSSSAATFFNTIWGVVVRPAETLSDVAERRPVIQGLIVLVCVGLLAGLSRYLATGEEVVEYFGVQTPFGGLMIPGWAVTVIVVNALLAGLLWVASRVFGGRASFAALLAGVCFIYSILILNSLVRLALTPFFDVALLTRIGALVWAAILMWQIILRVILVAQANGFSTGRSIATVIIPEIIVWGVFSSFLAPVVIGIRDRFG